MKKIYRARSLRAAERLVRELLKLHQRAVQLLEQYASDRKLLAKLASKTPQFYNPLDVYEAERIRDEILSEGRST